MKIITLFLAIVIGGCSHRMVTTKGENPRGCTTHYAAPVGDTVLTTGLVASGLVATAITAFLAAEGNSRPLSSSGGGGGGDPPVVGIGILTSLALFTGGYYAGASANYGYEKVAECRGARVRRP